jgi:hypothetical protein
VVISLSLSLSLSLCKHRAKPVFQGIMREKYVRKSGQNSQSFYGLKDDVKVDICFYKNKIFSISMFSGYLCYAVCNSGST